MKILILILIYINLYATQMLIPLYSIPEKWDLSNFNKNITVIINPDNGPGNFIQQNYVLGIFSLRSKGVKVYGYVYTNYGKRHPSLVKRDIYKWKDMYPNIDGIFLDETSIDIKHFNNYLDISKYSKLHNLNLILNAGIHTHQKYIDSGIAEIIITYENRYDDYINRTINKNKASPFTSLSAIIYNVQEYAIFDKVKNDFEYIYLTNDKDDNPWDSIDYNFIKYFNSTVDIN